MILYIRKKFLQDYLSKKYGYLLLKAALIKVAAMSPLTQWDKEKFRAAALTYKKSLMFLSVRMQLINLECSWTGLLKMALILSGCTFAIQRQNLDGED